MLLPRVRVVPGRRVLQAIHRARSLKTLSTQASLSGTGGEEHGASPPPTPPTSDARSSTRYRSLFIVGLGNPGKEYERTRHNVGFMVCDHFAREFLPKMAVQTGGERKGSVSFKTDKSLRAELIDGVSCDFATASAAASLGHDLVDATSERRRERTAEEGVPYPTAEISLVKPMTYMNRSGGPTRSLLDRKGVSPPTRRLKSNPASLNSMPELLLVYDDVALPFGSLRLVPKGGDGGQNGLADVIRRVGTNKFARLRVGVGPVRGDRKRFVLGNFDGAEVDMLPGILERAAEVLRVYAHRGFHPAANCANAIR